MAEKENNFAMPKKNLLWMIAGFAVMVLGYILLAGGGSKSPSEFSPEMFSFRRMVLSPIIILLGCAIVAVAIMYKGKKGDSIKK